MVRLNPNNMKVWFGNSEVWPIIACMGIAGVWIVYSLGHGVRDPDLSFNRTQRQSPIKDTSMLTYKGNEWVDSHKRFIPSNPGDINMFKSFDRKHLQ